jgi:hypothetical protein
MWYMIHSNVVYHSIFPVPWELIISLLLHNIKNHTVYLYNKYTVYIDIIYYYGNIYGPQSIFGI